MKYGNSTIINGTLRYKGAYSKNTDNLLDNMV